VVGLGRVYRRYGRTIPFFRCFKVCISGVEGRFVPMVMVVERGDAAGAWSFSEKHKKIALTVKQ
jgi:hypothetical protein